MAGGPFPTKYAEVNTYFNTVTPYLNTHAARLNVSPANLSTLNGLYNTGSVPQDQLGWIQLWVLYSNPATVTPNLREIVGIRREQMQDHLRLIYDDIPASALTTTDRSTLNLPLRDSEPTPVPAATFSPGITFDEIKNNIHVLRFQSPETPDSNAMPPGQKVELHSFVGDANLAENDVPFAFLMDTGNHLQQIDYLPAQKGKTAYYRARYKTDTGKTGPWSDMQSEIIL